MHAAAGRRRAGTFSHADTSQVGVKNFKANFFESTNYKSFLMVALIIVVQRVDVVFYGATRCYEATSLRSSSHSATFSP